MCIDNNWINLVKQYDDLIGNTYKDKNEKVYVFFGLVHAEDDYYFGMSSAGKVALWSCVGSLDMHLDIMGLKLLS